MTLSAQKPELAALEGDSLGARLQRRRRELGLRRIDAAERMGVDPKTLMWWERDTREPFVSAFPAIIGFLDYEPWPEPNTLADALRTARRRRGLNRAEAATLIGVDEGTWRRWEIGEWKPQSHATELLDAFLGFSVKKRFPTDVR